MPIPPLFTPAAIPSDEAFRLKSLQQLDVLDTRPEPEFDALVKVASLVCGKPISLISLVDAQRQWFKADVGLGAAETPRDVAFCAHAILDDQIFEVPDTLQDPRFAGNPLVLNPPDIRFYAGAPITLANGARVGTLCVIDTVPGELTAMQREVLQNLAIAAAHALEARRAYINEHRHAAQESQARREARALMATIDIHTIVSEADRHGTITACNNAYEAISGYSRDELIGRSHSMVNSAVHAPEFWSAMWATISSGMPWRGDICNRSKSGDVYWVDSMIAPFLGDDGLVERYVSISTNITQRVLAQQQQEALTRRFTLATESAGIGVWEWELATNILTWDDRIYSIYQRPRTAGNEPHTVWRETTHPADVVDAEARLVLAARGKKEFEKVFRIFRPSGEIRHIHAFARGVRDARDRIVKLVGVNIDVTEIHRARDALLSNKMLLDESQAIAKVGGWELDLQTGVLFWTDETYRIHETTPETFNPTVDAGLGYFLPESRATISAALDAAIGQGHGYDLELQTYTTQNRLIDVRTTCTVTLQDGKAIKLTGIFQDITERKQYERSLQEAREKAELATRSKAQFLANMSHEIRTPMNAIWGMLTLLEKSDLSAQQEDYVGKTKGAAHSLLGLLNDILDLSKVEAGKMTLDPHPFRLDNMLRDLAVILSAYGSGKPVDVLYDIDPALPDVLLGDAQRLQQVLVNLGGNAVKFTAQGQVIVRLQLMQSMAGTAHIAFAVQDSGIGISPDNQAHIFSGFSQAEASTTRKFGGTGLGLAISQQLVGLMGGNITLASALGQGSTFAFELELPYISDAKDIPAELVVPSTVSAPIRNVLVIDDNPVARRLTAQMTQSWHWPTDVAGGGAEALERIRERYRLSGSGGFPYGVVYLDWQMPDMDGWETARKVRQISHEMGGTRPGIVMMSSHTRDSLDARTSEEQTLLDGFLVKPVTASMLREAALGADSATHRLREARRAGGHARRLTGMRILVVEDNLINQQVAEELLMSEGALVSLAANGQLGVDAVAAAKPQFDAVLMDIQMPVMDGYTATQTIRSQLALSALPIVAMTANAMVSDRDECLAAGMTEHVGKPFDLPKLVQLLLRLTRRTGNGGDVELPMASDPGATGDAPQQGYEIDVQGAIHRMSGLESLYLRCAREFVSDLARTAEDWLAALPHNPQQAIMLMHTLKGTAALLGATRLSHEAARLEKLCHGPLTDQACTEQAEPLRNVVRGTQVAMQSVIDGITLRLAASADAPALAQTGTPPTASAAPDV